jgi:hypothetical protein
MESPRINGVRLHQSKSLAENRRWFLGLTDLKSGTFQSNDVRRGNCSSKQSGQQLKKLHTAPYASNRTAFITMIRKHARWLILHAAALANGRAERTGSFVGVVPNSRSLRDLSNAQEPSIGTHINAREASSNCQPRHSTLCLAGQCERSPFVRWFRGCEGAGLEAAPPGKAAFWCASRSPPSLSRGGDELRRRGMKLCVPQSPLRLLRYELHRCPRNVGLPPRRSCCREVASVRRPITLAETA